jgi:hypothetical protein
MLNLIKLSSACGILALLCTSAHAVPMPGSYNDTPDCDLVADIDLTHELGDSLLFNQRPAGLNEQIQVERVAVAPLQCSRISNPGGVGDDPAILDWDITIRNISREIWMDLFFVVDEGVLFDNADGLMSNPRAAAGHDETLAMALDFDGMNVINIRNTLNITQADDDALFEPGERWRFFIQDYQVPAPGAGMGPVFSSLDFGAQSPGVGILNSNASILANHLRTALPSERFPFARVPEPESLLLFSAGLLGLAVLRPRRSRRTAS